MTAVQLAARSPRPARGRLHGLTWTVLRTHRAALLVWTAFVVCGVAGLLWLQRFGEDVAARAGGPCGGPGMRACTAGFPWAIDDYLSYLGFADGTLAWMAPAVAAYAAGLLVGRELENGTAALAWTQSVTPARWLAAKLAIPAVLLTVGTGLLIAAYRLAWTAGDSAWQNPWFMDNIYRSTGPVGIAYALLALAVGVLSALAVRRALPAAGAAALGSLLLIAAGTAVRDHLWPKTVLTGRAAAEISNTAHWFGGGSILQSGQRVPGDLCYADSALDYHRCLSRLDAEDFYAVVHPSSHYWPLQLVESALVLAVAAGLVWIAFRLLRRRAV